MFSIKKRKNERKKSKFFSFNIFSLKNYRQKNFFFFDKKETKKHEKKMFFLFNLFSGFFGLNSQFSKTIIQGQKSSEKTFSLVHIDVFFHEDSKFFVKFNIGTM